MSPCPPRCSSIGPRRGLRKNQLGWRVKKVTEVRQEAVRLTLARAFHARAPLDWTCVPLHLLPRSTVLFSTQARVSLGRQITQEASQTCGVIRRNGGSDPPRAEVVAGSQGSRGCSCVHVVPARVKGVSVRSQGCPVGPPRPKGRKRRHV